MATLKEAIEYAKKNPNSAFANALKQKIESGEADEQAKAESIDLGNASKQEPSVVDKVTNKLGEIASKRLNNIKQDFESGDATNPNDPMLTGAEKVLRAGGQVAGGIGDVIGEALGAGAKAADNATGNIASDALKQGAEYILQTDLGKQGLEFAKQGVDKYNEWKKNNPNAAKDLEAVVNIGSLLPVGKVASLAKTGVEDVAKQLASKTAKTVLKAGESLGTATDALGKTGKVVQGAVKGVKNITKNVATNLDEFANKEKIIESLPTKVTQNAARQGIDIADINTLSRIDKGNMEQVKSLLKAADDYSRGITNVDPQEIVGKPIVTRLKSLNAKKDVVGKKLGEVAKNLGTVNYEEVHSSVLNRLKQVQGLKELGIDAEGKLDFSRTSLASSLTEADRKVIEKAFEEAVISGNGQKAHMFRQELFEILDGQKRSLTNITDTQDKALNAIRAGLSDVLEAKNPDYKKLSNEYRKIVQPISDLRKLSRTLDPNNPEDVLNLSAGLLARRLTSNAASNPQIRMVLKALDDATKVKGKSLTESQDLIDAYNVISKYYDVAPKTGFKGQIESAIPQGGVGEAVIGAAKQVAGKTPAVRQKALNDLLEELSKTK